MKTFTIIISSLILGVLIYTGFLLFVQKNNPQGGMSCKNKNYEIPFALQSGEKGVLYITDNHCELWPKQANSLSFTVLDDGSVQDSMYESRLYIWARQENMTTEEQIHSLVSGSVNKKNCFVEKSPYKQFDQLDVYAIVGDDCGLFGEINDFSSENFVEVNGLLIAERHDGADGISPFNLSSIRFLKSSH